MMVLRLIIMFFLVAYCSQVKAQNDALNQKYLAPSNSYFTPKVWEKSKDYPGLKIPRKLAVNRYTSWDITAFTKGALVIQQGVRLGHSRYMIHAHLGKNVFTDFGQKIKFNIVNTGYSSNADANPLDATRFGHVDFSKFNLYSQVSISWDFKYSNAGLELGCRFISYVVDVPRSEKTGGLFGWNIGTVHEVDNVPFKVFTPFFGYNVLEPTDKDKTVVTSCIGIGVDFYEYQKFRRVPDSNGAYMGYALVPSVKYNFSPIPILFFTFSVGSGNRAE